MRAIVIGATGHIGTYLVPRLVEAGMEVVAVSRGRQAPYHPHGAWSQVQRRVVDREAAEAEGTFGRQMAALEPDVVVDLISYTRSSTQQLVEALVGRIQLFIHCGTVWTYGYAGAVPTTEADPKRPWGAYGVGKKEIEDYLHEQTRRHGFPATVFHPGHIVGPGWEFIGPAGNRDPEVIQALATGGEVVLPHLGLATLHHVHADDLAQLCQRMIARPGQAVGESLNAVSERALTLRAYAEAVAGWFGRPANLRFAEWDAWKQGRSAEDVRLTGDHLAHSPSHSIEKARSLLGYAPRYTSLQAVFEALCWAIDHGQLPGVSLPS
ncbi:MAG: NAD(P)-dependent oxidoreductase [Gemmatimonadota bacterium]